MTQLANIAASQPHVAYACLTHGLTSKWAYLNRTTPAISDLHQTLKDVISIPALTNRPPPNDLDRRLFALPARLGGLAINNPTDAESIFFASSQISKPLSDAILAESPTTVNVVESVIEMLCGISTIHVRRKTSTNARGTKRWWFVLHDEESVLCSLD